MVGISFIPVEKQLVKAVNTITIEFDPDGNVSLDVSPSFYNFSTIYGDSSKTSGGTTFTIWNNGSEDNMVTDLQITGSPSDLTIDEDSHPSSNDNYALYLIGGTASGVNAWCKESTTIELDSDLDLSGTETFGFNLHISSLTSNYSWQSMTITLTGAES